MVKSLFSNIIVAISGSGASVQAAKYAIVLAKLYRCSVSAVYVVDCVAIRQLGASGILVRDECEEMEKSLEQNGKRYLTFVAELGEAKGVRVETDLRSGAVWPEILSAAEAKNCDLIILGGHEKNRGAKDIISALHCDIMLHSKCSVLIEKEQDVDVMYKQI
jgi:nucleotide-binding universal stress UspA family protein